MQQVANAEAEALKALEELQNNSGLHDKKTGKKIELQDGDKSGT